MQYIIIFLITALMTYIFYEKKVTIKENKVLKKIKNAKAVRIIKNSYTQKIQELQTRGLLSEKLSKLTAGKIISLSIISYVLIFTIMYKIVLGVVSTALIIALPMLVLPKIIINFVIDRDKQKIMQILPAYIINLKNYVEQDNNVIKAIKETICLEPLNKHIERFNLTVQKGININEAFKKLKNSVDIKFFSSFVTAIESCNANGGSFSKILEKFANIISKENINRERTKEKAYSSVIILCVMLIINIYLIFSFVFSNPEYSAIVKETMLGRIILDINAISYLVIGYIVSKIYRIGE